MSREVSVRQRPICARCSGRAQADNATADEQRSNAQAQARDLYGEKICIHASNVKEALLNFCVSLL